jgi:hypothetical protein
MLLVSSGTGSIHLVHVGHEYEMQCRLTRTDIHSDLLREIAPNKGHCAQFASGGTFFGNTFGVSGFDETLCIVDLSVKENKSILQSVKLDGAIGSVRWPTCNQSKKKKKETWLSNRFFLLLQTCA